MISVERARDAGNGVAGGVAVVRLEHGKVNALDIELCQAISATFTDLDAAAVVFTGAGRAFSAGVDLWRVVDGGDDYVTAFIPALVDAFAAVFTCELPVVAAINGHAIAGGCILAAACDYRIMAAGRLGIPEMLVGVPFPATALAIVEHAFGPVAARRLAFTGELLSAGEALARGLVDELAANDSDRGEAFRDVTARDVTARDETARDVTARDVTARDVTARDVTACLDRAIAHARHLAANIPRDTYAATKRHLNRLPGPAAHDLAHDLAHDSAYDSAYDAEVVRLWRERVADGWIAAYMERTVKRQSI